MATPPRTPTPQRKSSGGTTGASSQTSSRGGSLRQKLRDQKWLTLIGLPVLLFALIQGILSIWGVMFIYWGFVSISVGQVYLLQDIDRDDDPVLFWLIIMLWLGSGGFYILSDFVPGLWL